MAITTNGKVSITNLQVGSSDDLAGIISDESGTGVLAFTTSPTFTTPVLGTASATGIELGHATDTTLSRLSAGVLAVEGTAVLLSGGALGTPSSVTLTNGTDLPVSGISASTSDAIGVGTIELGHATDTTIARASSGVVTIEGVNVVTTSSTDTLTNKTLTSPTVNTATIAGGTLANSVIKGIEEDINVVASAATGTINFDVDTASIWYYTTDATADFTLNFRFSSGVSLDTALATGDSITLVFLNTNGETPYYPDVIQIDGSAVTPKVPATISAGNASAIDAYSFTIIKTDSATFTVLETQTKFE
jgi:hypothetical protein